MWLHRHGRGIAPQSIVRIELGTHKDVKTNGEEADIRAVVIHDDLRAAHCDNSQAGRRALDEFFPFNFSLRSKNGSRFREHNAIRGRMAGMSLPHWMLTASHNLLTHSPRKQLGTILSELV